MQRFYLLILIFASGLSIGAETFDARFVQATQNVTSSAEGTEYDRRLGTYFQSAPGWARELNECQDRNPGPQYLRGFFEFSSAGTYRLVVDPDTPFSQCFARIHEGKDVPAPPRLPYLSPITFTAAR